MKRRAVLTVFLYALTTDEIRLVANPPIKL